MTCTIFELVVCHSFDRGSQDTILRWAINVGNYFVMVMLVVEAAPPTLTNWWVQKAVGRDAARGTRSGSIQADSFGIAEPASRQTWWPSTVLFSLVSWSARFPFACRVACGVAVVIFVLLPNSIRSAASALLALEVARFRHIIPTTWSRP